MLSEWRTVLILGGIRSGKSRYAESLVASAGSVRRISAEPGDDLTRLAGVLAEAKPDGTLLVDPVDAWLGTGRRADTVSSAETVASLAAAVRDCAARLVLVSPEVGLSVTPSTVANRTLADTMGAANQALAHAADAVVLVIAGQPIWLKGAGIGGIADIVARAPRVTAAETQPVVSPAPDLSDLRGLPVPDDDAKAAARDHLATLGAAGLGALADVVTFAAGTQGSAVPSPWRQIRVLVLQGDHRGAASAGAQRAAHRAGQLRAGTSPVAQLAGQAGANVQIVEATAAAPMEDGPAMTDDEAEQALTQGWRLAQHAADEGVDLIVLAAIGEGAETAAAAVTSVTASGEPAALLGWVRTADGLIDDPAWMRRCAAVRDAVHRVRAASRTSTRAVLAELGGADIAIATGVLLGAAARRTPVLLDGPVGAAAGLVARSLAGQSRHWCMLPDHGGHPTVSRAAEVLNLSPLLDLRLDLGEGAAALAALPLLRTALTLAATFPGAQLAGKGI